MARKAIESLNKFVKIITDSSDQVVNMKIKQGWQSQHSISGRNAYWGFYYTKQVRQLKCIFTSAKKALRMFVHCKVLRSSFNVVALLSLQIFCASLPANAAISYQQRADELLPVDCLLPGAVRKLGNQMTYVTQRRPIKTTGVDCEIRGGEYVLYDRANYQTCLLYTSPSPRDS